MIHQNGGEKMKKYGSFSGTVTMIQDYLVGSDEELKGCFKLMSLVGDDGSIVNFVISPTTYFLDHDMVSVGDTVTGFYDVNGSPGDGSHGPVVIYFNTAATLYSTKIPFQLNNILHQNTPFSLGEFSGIC
jgi:hypothetical protein